MTMLDLSKQEDLLLYTMRVELDTLNKVLQIAKHSGSRVQIEDQITALINNATRQQEALNERMIGDDQ